MLSWLFTTCSWLCLPQIVWVIVERFSGCTGAGYTMWEFMPDQNQTQKAGARTHTHKHISTMTHARVEISPVPAARNTSVACDIVSDILHCWQPSLVGNLRQLLSEKERKYEIHYIIKNQLRNFTTKGDLINLNNTIKTTAIGRAYKQLTN